jgi:hypothetical protein
MDQIRLGCAVLIVLAVLGGTFGSAPTKHEPWDVGGYKVIEADLHVHSFPSDGMLSPFGLVMLARLNGLHAIAITDHNQIVSGKVGRWISQTIGGPTILVGQEVTAPDFHIVAVGLKKTVSWNQSARSVTSEIHEQGGVVIAAHPTARYWPGFKDILEELDGSEVGHPRILVSSAAEDRSRHFHRFVSEHRAKVSAIGSSDYHWFNSLGLLRTFVFVRGSGEEAILEALREGRTVTYDAGGAPVGNPALARLLPLRQTPPSEYTYAGAGAMDVVERTLGWVGLVVLAFARRKRRVGETE